MSYILDALRRAQAERGRGGVPGLHTPAVAVPSSTDDPGRSTGSSGRRGVWLLVAVAAAVAGALAWLQFGPRSAARHEPVVVARAPAPPPMEAAAPASASVPAPAPVPAPVIAKASEPAPVEIDVTPPPPAPPAPPKPVAQTTPAPVPAPARRGEETPRAPAAANPAVPAAPVAAPAAPIYSVANLPSAVREQLPSLQLAGITYSTNPKYRMVIVNGQVLHEGDSAGPGLVLERIENARTIWAFRGYRYALP